MPSHLSQPFLSQLQGQVTHFIDLAQGGWQLLPHSTFSRRPGEGQWGANECLQHLNSYCQYYLPAIERAMEMAPPTQKPATVFKTGWLGHYFTQLMMPGTPGRPAKKMKAPKNHQPAGITDSHLVIAEFIAHQQKLLQLLGKAGSHNLNIIRVPISISKMIKLKLGDTFNFLVAHQQRHVLQATRALEAAKLTEAKDAPTLAR